MRVIALTGGIAMGKSTAAAAFRRARVPVFDSDAEVRRLQARGGRAVVAIAAAFPGAVRDGAVDRAALRAQALASPAALGRLEAILHPLVRAAQHRFLARMRGARRRLVVLDIPLLFETGAQHRFDCVLVVSAPACVQRARLRRRGVMDAAQIEAVLARQVADRVRLAGADVVVRTGLSRGAATRAVRAVIRSKQGCSFLKKRTKKLLPVCFGVAATAIPGSQKSFASFLQKRRPYFFPRGPK